MVLQNVFDTLKERGFIEQTTHEDEIRELLGKEKVTFYIGFDPTAKSLTVGHFLTIMAMAHMQRAGHRPIALIGGGTVMVGDPTGKTDMRKMMTVEEIEANAQAFKKQFSRFIDFSDEKALMVNNADWLRELNYIEFLREIGVHFSVNRMLSAEAYKSRMERGLTFLEFNYMIMQSYDFYKLHQEYGCVMQLGGNDQWSNILGGVELIRKMTGKQAYGMTFTLLTTSDGKKMGKTEAGAIWLDPELTSPYDFYQYWRNVEDSNVERLLRLLTFLPMDEVRRLGALEGADINHAKEVLAYEITKNVHGLEAAEEAQKAARALFGGTRDAESIPTTEIPLAEFGEGMDLISLLTRINLVNTRSEGRRLILQGGVYVADRQTKQIDYMVSQQDFDDEGHLLVRKGKKVYHRVKLVE
ncbi:MAG TPA: tyrosine--tRNA ligase [Firmicutes bacterium]|nr:tyrosine--tRNA ligase [Bacillota bacterium]